MIPKKLEIVIVLPDARDIKKVCVPQCYKVKELIIHLMARFSLPDKHHDRYDFVYICILKRTDAQLDCGKTLKEQGVRNGDILCIKKRLMGCMSLGTGSLPDTIKANCDRF